MTSWRNVPARARLASALAVAAGVLAVAATAAPAPAVVRTRPGAVAHLRLSWTHPESWRKLRRVELRVLRGAKTVGGVVVRPGDAGLRARGAIRLVMPGSRLIRDGRTVTAELALRVDAAPAAQPLRVDVAAVDRRGRRQLERGAATIRVGAADRRGQ